MARETRFGTIYSHQHLHLIQQKVDIQPAEPKLNRVDIPGADGSKDLSELPAGRVVYKDRKITWTFALYPGDKWDDKHSQVSNALNGLKCTIHLDTDPDWYYEGRLTVKKYNRDKALRQITVEAVCFPYKLKYALSGGDYNINSIAIPITLSNKKKPAIPSIYASVQAEIRWNEARAVISAGSWYSSLDIELPEGDSVIYVRAVNANETGYIRIQYREGSL